MTFTPQFLDEIRTRLPCSEVIGRRVKLSRKGREYAGLCPFHNEKTPSFTVSDKKGFYHCFSSGKHGDIISFLQETERLTFSEAVERLAAEAGMSLPEPDARAAQDQSASPECPIEAVRQWIVSTFTPTSSSRRARSSTPPARCAARACWRRARWRRFRPSWRWSSIPACRR